MAAMIERRRCAWWEQYKAHRTGRTDIVDEACSDQIPSVDSRNRMVFADQ